MGRSKGLDVRGFYYVLFNRDPPEDLTVGEILAEIHDRNPQIYDLLEKDLRRTNVDKLYPIKGMKPKKK